MLNIGEKVVFSISMTKEQQATLDLMALRHEISRSAMLSRLTMLHADVDVNIREIAERITAKYCEQNIPFETFKESAKIWLEQAKITPYYIERIIEEFTKNYETE